MTSNLQPTLHAYDVAARKKLQESDHAYFFGGAGEEYTAIRNKAEFNNTELRPRVLNDLQGGSTNLSLFGETLAHPIIIAPTAYHKLLHPQGEIATALGAGAQQAKMILSAQSSVKLSETISVCSDCDWFQLYWLGSREATIALVEEARKAGYRKIVLSVDAPVSGVRDREIESGFVLPQNVSAENLIGKPMPKFAPLSEGESAIFDRIAHVIPNWEDIVWLCEVSLLPVLIKGILHPDDALRAIDAGACGLIVSNHGGRVLDTVPATLKVLPEIANCVNNQVPVLVDGGIRRGSDIFKALALGAKAVLVGRAIIAGLAVAGAEGVSHVLRLLRDELEITMMLTGCKSISDISPDSIYRTKSTLPE